MDIVCLIEGSWTRKPSGDTLAYVSIPDYWTADAIIVETNITEIGLTRNMHWFVTGGN